MYDMSLSCQRPLLGLPHILRTNKLPIFERLVAIDDR